MTSEHEYTPTEDEWRDATTYSLCDWWGWFETTKDRDLAWARFIAQVKAEAWDEGFRTSERCWEELWDITTPDEDRTSPINPYRKDEKR